MLEIPRRKFLLSSLAALFSAPAIVRASSLMQVRGDRFALQGDFLAPLAVDYTSAESLNYEYWAIGPMGLAKYTAREMLAAPAGVFTPWLAGLDANGNGVGFRAVNEHQKGLAVGQLGSAEAILGLVNYGDRLDRDPVVRKLRGEQDVLLRELREKREVLAQHKRETTYHRSMERQARAHNREQVALALSPRRTTFAQWERNNDRLLAVDRNRDPSREVSPLAFTR